MPNFEAKIRMDYRDMSGLVMDCRAAGLVDDGAGNVLRWTNTAPPARSLHTGSHDGSNNVAILQDLSQFWRVNELRGKLVWNTTDGSVGLVTANTLNTVTATLGGGTDDDWDTSDAYRITTYRVGNPHQSTLANRPVLATVSGVQEAVFTRASSHYLNIPITEEGIDLFSTFAFEFVPGAAANPDQTVLGFRNYKIIARSSIGAGGFQVNGTPAGIANWDIRTSAADEDWRGIAYAGGIFASVASTGVGNRAMSSPDGVTWTIRVSAADEDWRAIAHNGTRFAAVASSGVGNRVMTSDNGTSWTIRTSAADNDWRGIASNSSGRFVAVADTGVGNRVMSSDDGITWTIRTSAADNDWRSVACSDTGRFVAVAISGVGNRVMSSDDGITWTIRTSAADRSWRSVVWGNGLFVAVASTGAGDRVMSSPDGITWTSRTSAANESWRGVTYGNGLFVATATSGVGDRVMTSPNGITWTSRTSAADEDWQSVFFGQGLFAAVATSGVGNRVMTSGNPASLIPSNGARNLTEGEWIFYPDTTTNMRAFRNGVLKATGDYEQWDVPGADPTGYIGASFDLDEFCDMTLRGFQMWNRRITTIERDFAFQTLHTANSYEQDDRVIMVLDTWTDDTGSTDNPSRINPTPSASHFFKRARVFSDTTYRVQIECTVHGVVLPDTELGGDLFAFDVIEFPGLIPAFTSDAGWSSIIDVSLEDAGHYTFAVLRPDGGQVFLHLDATVEAP